MEVVQLNPLRVLVSIDENVYLTDDLGLRSVWI